ncbi:argininosuccinate lyase [Oceanobacillus indicireducens]|uniref:Argininosuccinate lyase n=1 Tax=Oceanobacillus indicireducens TaxID=1004261 RepID=A0A917XV36_9BACI|nr:argininosuccinate lyase [Oceanobacillus indicireducens]GGN53702.1 argininosuccinate lyase [Oceanobacillus indicireducens]
MVSLHRQKILEKEGNQFPAKTYKDLVLEPAYNQAKFNAIRPMLQIHFAHLIMLVEEGIVKKEEAVKIVKSLNKIDIKEVGERFYNGSYEDLFFEVEDFLIQDAGELAGNLHIARSRNDMGIAIYRMNIRERLLYLIEAALHLRQSLIELTEEHIDTVMIGYTHTQQAQPTTLGHYFNAMTDMLTRDIERLQAAFVTVNKSSMGAAALTTSGFSINRGTVQELLGFEGIIDNAWDAVSGADYIGETATAVQLAAIDLGRSTQDLLLWGTQEFGAFKLFSPYVQISSIMPQKQNPVSIEHTRAMLSSVKGDVETVLSMMHNTPFGDIVDTEDDMQPYMWNALEKLTNIYYLLSGVLMTMKVNKKKLLKRAKESFANVTELADTLVRSNNLSFRKAHEIVSASVQDLVENDKESLRYFTLDHLNKHAQQIIGHKLNMRSEELADALDPEHFIKIRSLEGGPSKERMQKTVEVRYEQQRTISAWLAGKRKVLEAASKKIDSKLKSLMPDDE